MPPTDLMAEPPEALNPPITLDEMGEPQLLSRDALPYILETNSIIGTLRSRILRLQNWIRIMMKPADDE